MLKLYFHGTNFGRVGDSEGELEKCVCKNWCCRYFDLMGVVEGCLLSSETWHWTFNGCRCELVAAGKSFLDDIFHLPVGSQQPGRAGQRLNYDGSLGARAFWPVAELSVYHIFDQID